MHSKALGPTAAQRKKTPAGERMRLIVRNYELYLFMLLPFAYFIIFKYIPMYGVQLAFRNFIATKGIWGSPWVGFEHFRRFFNSYYFWDLIRNTVGISLYGMLAGFPMPILFALLLNEVGRSGYKRFIQTVTYAPHFISTVVMVGMIIAFLSPSTGIVNHALASMGVAPIAFMQKGEWFKTVYVFSGIWQGLGWSSIIYLAALAGVDPALHESAMIDGAGKWQRIIHINIPAIIPTITILFILNTGRIMSVGFEKIYLMQNDLNLTVSDVIATYVYRAGLENAQFSFATAVGLFNSVINCLLILTVNQVSHRIGDTSLW